MARPVFIVDGSRTPFLKARSGPGPFTPVDLAVQCGRPLLARQPFAPTDFDQTWTFYDVDLSSAVAAAGIDFGSGFLIRFQQYGEVETDYAERRIDEVTLRATDPIAVQEDWYRVTLGGGDADH